MIRQPLSELKRENALLWSLRVGRLHSRNNIVVRDDHAFFGTSGDHWNLPDDRDGVHCVDLRSAREVWFAPTFSDANEVALFEDVLLVGTDQGKALAISRETGAVVQSISLKAAVYARAFELQTDRGPTAIMISHAGEIVRYDRAQNDFAVIGEIPHKVRANPIALKFGSFLAGAQGGAVILVELMDNTVRSRIVFQIPPHKASPPKDYMLHPKDISSIVALSDDQIIISYVRNTYDRRPPITCFSLKTGEKIWDAGRIRSASREANDTFGNCRIVPPVWNRLLLATFSYNDALHAFSAQTGKWDWRLRLDAPYFQNWSSPIVSGDRLYVARVNGVLSVIGLKLRKIVSSYSVEVFDYKREGSEPSSGNKYEPWPNIADDLDSRGPMPNQELIAGICATPAIWQDKILIGTVSGHLCCFRQP